MRAEYELKRLEINKDTSPMVCIESSLVASLLIGGLQVLVHCIVFASSASNEGADWECSDLDAFPQSKNSFQQQHQTNTYSKQREYEHNEYNR